MNNSIREYNRFVSEIVDKYYPELKGRKIEVIEKEAKYRAKATYILNGLRITISYKVREFPIKVKKRIIAHELSHFIDFIKDGWLKTNTGFLKYLLSKKTRYECEKRVNVREIRRGLGFYILDVIKENKKRGLSYSLTEKEVRNLIKKYGIKK